MDDLVRETDTLLTDIADYVNDYEITSDEAYDTARYVLMDTLGSGILALRYPECTKHLGPIVPGTIVPNGARVPGTSFVLDPVHAAFNIGCAIRWLDYNDTWLAKEWGHPSDNLGGILAVADYLSRENIAEGKPPLSMHDVLTAMIKAHEIQGSIALNHSFNRVGLDHVLLVKIATTAVVTHMLGGSRQEIVNAISNAWIDNSSLRTYRHYPNAGSRKSWAAGDATSRGVRLALMAIKGEMGYATALSAKSWGFQDVMMNGQTLSVPAMGSYVMENVLFKVSFPAEFHAQTAVEAAIDLHEKVKDHLYEIDRIDIITHEAAIRIIDKTGPLRNPADRDHCLQYMTAVGLIFGELNANHYEEDAASNPIIDRLRNKMVVTEREQYTKDYLDPTKRSIPNQLQVHFQDGTSSEKIEVEYPLGHQRRREEAKPQIIEKCRRNLLEHFPPKQSSRLLEQLLDERGLTHRPVHEFMNNWTY